jgi:prepilin-type N-terminal cleavage/methylation domain-containing protein
VKVTMRGFTLLEMLIAIAIVAILAVVGVSNFSHLSADSKVVQASRTVAQALRTGRIRALEVASNVTVKIANDAVTLQVQNGAAGTVRTELPAGVSVTGLTSFEFNPSGVVTTAGAVRLGSTIDGSVSQRVVTVSGLGQVIQ